MLRFSIIAASIAFAALASGAAEAQPRIEVGVLTCRGGEVTSFVLGSEHQLRCRFRSKRGMRQYYTGVIRRIGIDIGFVQRSRLVWSVFAPTRALDPRDLTGSYAGVTAGGTLGVGGSANLLVGGSNNSISLQPLSVEAQTGLNLTAGFAELQLRPR